MPESNALLALMSNDEETARTILDGMLPGELTTLADTDQDAGRPA